MQVVGLITANYNLPALLITHVYHKITVPSADAHITQRNVYVNVSGFRGIEKLSTSIY